MLKCAFLAVFLDFENGCCPSVKVPSISMENGGVLERAKMGISIFGEKE